MTDRRLKHRGQRGVGHRQPDRTCGRTGRKQVQLAVGLAQVDTGVALHVDTAFPDVGAIHDAAVESRSSSTLPTLPMRSQVDTAGGDVGQVFAMGAVSLRWSRIPPERAASDTFPCWPARGSPAGRRQFPRGRPRVRTAPSRRRSYTCTRAGGHAVDKIGLDEIGGGAHATPQRRERDANTADVGERSEVMSAASASTNPRGASRNTSSVVERMLPTRRSSPSAASTATISRQGSASVPIKPLVSRSTKLPPAKILLSEQVHNPGISVGVGTVDRADAQVVTGLGQAEGPGSVDRGGRSSGEGRRGVNDRF